MNKRPESIQVSTLGHDELGKVSSINAALDRFLKERETGHVKTSFHGNRAQREKAIAAAKERQKSFKAPSVEPLKPAVAGPSPAPTVHEVHHVLEVYQPPAPPPMKEDPKIIGSRLKQAREQAGWTVPSLAEAIGFKPIALYDAHYGKNKPALDKIVEFLHINPAFLRTGQGEIFLTAPPEAPAKRKPGPRTARAKKPDHPLAAKPSDLLTALQRASAAAEAFQAAKDELDAALADLDALRA